MELNNYKKTIIKQPINLVVDNKDNIFEVDIISHQIPLGDLLSLYFKLKKKKWYMYLPVKRFYYDGAIKDIETALNVIKIETKTSYIEEIL